ncbi:MAG: ExbD/TolR family protein [Pseudomonadales bacterium]
MKFARRRRQEVEINLTPLIDVVFLLLIFFMVSTTFTRESRFVIDLPEASMNARPDKTDQIEVSVSKDGGYAVNGVGLVNREARTLKQAIRAVAGGSPAENAQLPIVITADAAAPHQAVVTAMDAAGQLGFARLSITTKIAADEDI